MCKVFALVIFLVGDESEHGRVDRGLLGQVENALRKQVGNERAVSRQVLANLHSELGDLIGQLL